MKEDKFCHKSNNSNWWFASRGHEKLSNWYPSGDICQVEGTVIWLLFSVSKASERVQWPWNTQKIQNGMWTEGWKVVAVIEKSRKCLDSEAITGNVTSLLCPHLSKNCGRFYLFSLLGIPGCLPKWSPGWADTSSPETSFGPLLSIPVAFLASLLGLAW